jgi:hypothetical protein
MSKLFTWSALLAVAATAAFGPTDAEAQPGDRVFTGQVTCIEDSHPLAGVEVTVFSDGSDVVGRDTTDENGNYKIAIFEEFGASFLIYVEGRADTVTPVVADTQLRHLVGDPNNAFHVATYNEAQQFGGLDPNDVLLQECSILVFNSMPSSVIGEIVTHFLLADCPDEGPGVGDPEGCPPIFWIRHLHPWFDTPYRPWSFYKSSFGAGPYFLPLYLGLFLHGNLPAAFLRESIAALLNAAHPNVNYPMTVDEVKAAVRGAIASGKLHDATRAFYEFNRLGCDIRS